MALASLGALLLAAAAVAQGEFEVYVWRSTPEPEGARAVWERMGGVIAQRGESRERWLEAGLAVGLFNAAGRDALHLERESAQEAERWQRWYDTRDPAHAVRSPCLSQPRTQAELARTLARSLEGGDVRRLAWVALGDEVALSAHAAPGELCLCAHCGEAWRRYLAERDDLDEAERAAWADPTSGDTDRARLALADGELAALGPWLVRRQFQSALVEGALRALERQARAAQPDAALALLGLGAQSAFGTPRLERGFSELEVLEAYRESDARELLLALRGPRTRVLLTVFPDLHEAERVRADVWEHALAGGDGVVLWSDASLCSDPARVADLAATLAGVRALRGALGGARLARAASRWCTTSSPCAWPGCATRCSTARPGRGASTAIKSSTARGRATPRAGCSSRATSACSPERSRWSAWTAPPPRASRCWWPASWAWSRSPRRAGWRPSSTPAGRCSSPASSPAATRAAA